MKITPEMIEENIASEHYFTAFEGLMGCISARAASQARQGDGQGISFDGFINALSLEDLDGARAAESSLGKLTICVLVLQDGFTVTGESAPINPDSFDPEIGRQVARRRAVDKIWPLMGYAALRERKIQQGKNLVRRETPAAGGDE